MNSSIEHKRVNKILLGALERPALQWLAKKMPAWVSPDLLTAVGFVGSLLIFAGYVLTNKHAGFLWLASFGFVLNWFGDSLDGTLARHRKIERPRYGFFVDHTIDAMAEVLVFLGIGLSPYVDFELATLALVGYLLMSILVYVNTYVSGEFRISYISLGPTEMRALAILTNVAIFFIGNPMLKLPFFEISFYNLVVGFVTALLFGGFIVVTLMRASQLSKMDSNEKA